MNQLNVATVLTHAMEILQSDDDLGREETDRIFGEHFAWLTLQKQKQLSAGAEIGNEADVRLSLQNGKHRH